MGKVINLNKHYAKVIPMVKNPSPTYAEVKEIQEAKSKKEFTDYCAKMFDDIGIDYTDKRGK